MAKTYKMQKHLRFKSCRHNALTVVVEKSNNLFCQVVLTHPRQLLGVSSFDNSSFDWNEFLVNLSWNPTIANNDSIEATRLKRSLLTFVTPLTKKKTKSEPQGLLIVNFSWLPSCQGLRLALRYGRLWVGFSAWGYIGNYNLLKRFTSTWCAFATNMVWSLNFAKFKAESHNCTDVKRWCCSKEFQPKFFFLYWGGPATLWTKLVSSQKRSFNSREPRMSFGTHRATDPARYPTKPVSIRGRRPFTDL